MTPSRHARRLAALLLLSALSALSACGDDAVTPPADGPLGFDRRAMLAHLADDILIPTYDRFVTDTATLSTALAAHCDALAAGGDTSASLAAARGAWIAAIDTWEASEAILVGPAARIDNTIRNRIYSWPFVAPCTIDQDLIVRWRTPAMYDVTTRFDNARSLSAIESLLYNTTDTSACAVMPNEWEAQAADRPKARCALAATIAGDVAVQARALADAWKPAAGNYRDQLVLAGTAASSIESEREAVNMVSDALFYVDRMVWDMKVREPAGIKPNACGAIEAACVREVELRYADHATAAIRANLAALRVGFTGTGDGTDGPGFDDYMIAVGAADVAARVTGEIDAAIAAAAALPDGYIGALTDNRTEIVALSEALHTIIVDFKTQFLTVLGLDIPAEIAGDND
jgi:predicted lipoprotein